MPSLDDIASALDSLRDELTAQGVTDHLGEVNWTYDREGKHTQAVIPAGAIVMGFNAGAGGSGSEARWRTKCDKLTMGISGGYMLAELVLISSFNIADLRAAHGRADALIRQCAAVNLAVIAHHRPKVILQTGFDDSEAVQDSYGLVVAGLERAYRPAHPTHTLLKHYVMPDQTPWLAIRHPSSMGFSNSDIAAIRSYAAEHCGVQFLN